jgi:hypothetical protein
LITIGLLYRIDNSLARLGAAGMAAGAVATVALEAIRLPGFWLGFMPGNLPRLMGVLLLNQFAAGPSLKSDIAGWAYHFWNGASFGLIYDGLVDGLAAGDAYTGFLSEGGRSSECCKQRSKQCDTA